MDASVLQLAGEIVKKLNSEEIENASIGMEIVKSKFENVSSEANWMIYAEDEGVLFIRTNTGPWFFTTWGE